MYFTKDVVAAATARIICEGTSCDECHVLFDTTECPRDYETKENVRMFMRELYTRVQRKYTESPDWLDISFDELESILEE